MECEIIFTNGVFGVTLAEHGRTEFLKKKRNKVILHKMTRNVLSAELIKLISRDVRVGTQLMAAYHLMACKDDGKILNVSCKYIAKIGR